MYIFYVTRETQAVCTFPGHYTCNSIAKIVSDTERMKNTPTDVCAKTAFVTLSTGIILSYSLACTSGCGEFYGRWVVGVCAGRL
jgi:hypothetical protein